MIFMDYFQKKIRENNIFPNCVLLTFEKQAPICTFGVGGKPFDIGWGFTGSLLNVEDDDMAELLIMPEIESFVWQKKCKQTADI